MTRVGFLGARLPKWAWAPKFEPVKAPKFDVNISIRARYPRILGVHEDLSLQTSAQLLLLYYE